LFLRYIAEEIAAIKKVSLEEVAVRTAQNAKKLFALA
jgi:Tat protein secretion system quality control protein TatD with DNase activity